MSPAWRRPPLPEETFTNGFGEGEGELVSLTYPKPLPMRLDRWLVSQRSSKVVPEFRNSSMPVIVRVNGKTGKAKRHCVPVMKCSCGCLHRNRCLI